jgi:outer membrane protein TolC
MWKKTLGVLLIFALATFLPAQQQESSINLSLEDCIVKAMKYNLGVAIEVLTPENRQYALGVANEKFLPSFAINFYLTDQQQASYSFLDAADTLLTQQNQYGIDIVQQIPFGGNFTLSLNTSQYDTNRTGITINPSYRATLRFDFTQPLLRNFGYNLSRREIIVAKNNLNISEKDLQRSLQDTIYNVEEAYWRLVASIENLNVRQQSLKLAQDFLERQRRAVEIGTEAPIEILSARSEVATREADILAAEAEVKNSEDNLKVILNLTAEDPNFEFSNILPQEMPEFEKKEISLDQAFATAIQRRPDLDSTRIGLKNSEINLDFAKNQQLPGLNLSASYWSPGVSGTQLIYDRDNPWGPPIDEIPGGREGAIEDVFGFAYKNWSVRLTLDLPLTSIVSRASLAQARVDLQQATLRLKQQEQNIYLEIKQAVRAVDTNYRRVEAYKVARELRQRQLDAEEEKLKVGLTTPYFVLQYQRDLATAQTTELQAIIDYNLSLANLSRAMGISLEEKNISMVDVYYK